MSLDFASEVWEVLLPHIDYSEHKDAADSLINLLIDNNHEPEDIKASFRGNKVVLSALKEYLEQHEDDQDYDDEDYDCDSDDDEWD